MSGSTARLAPTMVNGTQNTNQEQPRPTHVAMNRQCDPDRGWDNYEAGEKRCERNHQNRICFPVSEFNE